MIGVGKSLVAEIGQEVPNDRFTNEGEGDMSSSYGAESSLRELASKLHDEAYDLEKAADVLKVLRDSEEHQAEIKSAKSWAKDWMK